MNTRSGAPRRGRFLLAVLLAGAAAACDTGTDPADRDPVLDPTLVAQGKDIFRHDTFGDEVYWTDTLRMHEVIARAIAVAHAESANRGSRWWVVKVTR